MQTSDSMSGSGLGHRHTQSYAVKQSSDTGFSHGSFHNNQPSIGGYADRHPQRANVPSINTRSLPQAYNGTDMQTPQTGYDMNYTPLLPSNLLVGSPFQPGPGSPSTYQSSQFQNFSNFPQQTSRQNQQGQMSSSSSLLSLRMHTRAWHRPPP
jgi:hypothetical protein